MSESSDDNFSDLDSDVSDEAHQNKKVLENGKRKVPLKKKSKEDSDDSSDNDSDDVPTAPQPVKKRKTLQDYLNEKVKHFQQDIELEFY